jgi:hypothetical protein
MGDTAPSLETPPLALDDKTCHLLRALGTNCDSESPLTFYRFQVLRFGRPYVGKTDGSSDLVAKGPIPIESMSIGRSKTIGDGA